MRNRVEIYESATAAAGENQVAIWVLVLVVYDAVLIRHHAVGLEWSVLRPLRVFSMEYSK